MSSPDRRFPAVTLILIVANLLAAFALLGNPDLAFEFGFRPDQPRFQSAITSLFLHANVVHLLGNMVFLAAVGAAVELATGSLRFASVYLFSGLAGVGTHYLVMRHHFDLPPYMGASGAIAGCIGYYCVRYNALRVPIAPKRSVSVAAVSAVWLLLQVVGAFVQLGDSYGTAYWAHLGGFAAGILASLVLRAPDLGERRLGHEVLDRMNERGPVAVATAARHHLERHPDDPKALQELARACAQTEDADGEGAAILKLLAIEPEPEHPSLLGRLVEIGQANRIPSARRAVLAEKFKDGHPAVSRALLTSVIEGPASDPQRPEAMLALAALEYHRAPSAAEALLSELLHSYPMHPCADLARKRGWVS